MSRGGQREGAGRKAKYSSMKAMKVPTDYILVIKELIKHLDETDMIDKNYRAAISEPFFIRSRKGKPQNVKFTTEPVGAVEEQLDLIEHIGAIKK